MSLINNRLRGRLRSTRTAEAIDKLVWLLAGIMLCFWAVGYLYLWLFPLSGGIASTADANSNSGLVAEGDSSAPGSGDATDNGDGSSDGDAALAEGSEDHFNGGSNDDSGSKAGSADSNSFAGTPSNSGNPPANSGQNSAPAFDANAIRQRVTASLTADHKREIKQLEAKHTQEQKSLMEKFTKDSGKNSAGFRQQIQDGKNKLNILQRKYDDLDRKYKTAQQTIAKNARVAAARPNPVASAPVVAGNNATLQQPSAPKQTSQYTTNEFRNWKSNRGTDAWLAFVRWENGEIVLVDAQDELFKIPLNRLSESDQRYVQQLK